MEKEFKIGDRVFHRTLKAYGTFLGYAWETDEECDVDFEMENGIEQRHVTVDKIVLVSNNKIDLPVRFVYTENDIEKTSIDENKRRKYIDELNNRLYGRK